MENSKTPLLICPECGSSNVFDLDDKFECDDCCCVWSDDEPLIK